VIDRVASNRRRKFRTRGTNTSENRFTNLGWEQHEFLGAKQENTIFCVERGEQNLVGKQAITRGVEVRKPSEHHFAVKKGKNQ
jgi:hypothetical protein